MGSHLCYLDVHDRALAVRHPAPFLRLPFSGKLFTLFDVFQVNGIVLGTYVGCVAGNRACGVLGAIAIGAFGGVIGNFVGNTPVCITWILSDYCGIRRTRTEVLRRRLDGLKSECGFYAEQLIAEMVLRGEPAESFWPNVLSLLRSPFPDNSHGWDNFNLWFPRIARQVHGFCPYDPPDRCRECVLKIENIEPCAAPLPRESHTEQFGDN
jgi:hypothetical protein